jgi:peptide/nickel transport system permease protein
LGAQYVAWIGQLAQGEFGRSLITHRPVVQELGAAARLTAVLGAAGWLLSYAIALPLGVLAGLRPGGWVDRVTTVVAAALASLPSFLIGIGLITVFALTLRWLPPAGARTGAHMVLPAATLALGLAAYSVRILRQAVVEVQAAFYMTAAGIRGLGRWQAFRRHGVRNAAIPVATFAALQLASVIDGFIVVETLFAYPGLGELLVTSLLARDVPVIAGAGLLLGLSYALLNLGADLLCLWLDPRRRGGVRR